MPYQVNDLSRNKKKKTCKQKSTAKTGRWTLSYTDKKGKHHEICHTSKANAEAQKKAIGRGKHEEDAHEAEALEEGGDDRERSCYGCSSEKHCLSLHDPSHVSNNQPIFRCARNMYENVKVNTHVEKL